MTKAEARYEDAKIRQRAAQRALFIADGECRPAEEILRLQRELQAAQAERRAAFAAWMDEEYTERKETNEQQQPGGAEISP